MFDEFQIQHKCLCTCYIHFVFKTFVLHFDQQMKKIITESKRNKIISMSNGISLAGILHNFFRNCSNY